MEKGMSSGEGLPSRSSQVSAVKTTVKELETKQSHKEKRGGFVLVHAGKLWAAELEDENNGFLSFALKSYKQRTVVKRFHVESKRYFIFHFIYIEENLILNITFYSLQTKC